ncbi:MAG: S8/S53 family peptidase [Rubrivivax sp.]|nr:S8/S53 family peptidase [Rubrivivax sp.]
MGSMANGRHTIVVGAVERDEHDRQRHVMGEYSSTGRRVDGFAFGKLDGAGFLTGSRKQLAGTSVAAALVTGTAAALALCGKSPPTDRGALLQALRRLASGRTPKLPGEAGGALSLPNQKGFVLPPGPGVETEPG